MTIVNLTGGTRGVSENETGINIESFKCTVQPEWKDYLANNLGESRAFAVASMELQVAVEGEVIGDTGLMAVTATSAWTPANTVAYFGAPTTGLYLDKAEVTAKRDGWLSMTADFTARAGIS